MVPDPTFKRSSNSFKMTAWPEISLNEGKITKLIKEIFKEEFKKQEVHITIIISGNFKLKMKEINILKEKVNDIKESI